MGPNVLFMCITALINHLSVQFLDKDVQEIFGKHPENSGNLLSQSGFYFPEISLSERLWSGERTTEHWNFLIIFLQCSAKGLFTSASNSAGYLWEWLHSRDLKISHINGYRSPPPVANAPGTHPASVGKRESSDHSVQRAELRFQMFFKENTQLGILSTDSLGYIKHWYKICDTRKCKKR